jgi:hypothetical protein
MSSFEYEVTTEQQRLQQVLALNVGANKLRGIDSALGMGGVGSFVLRNVLNSDQVEIMQAEILDPHCVQWRDNHDRFFNKRGLEIIENHTVYALKLSRGDQSPVARVPHMRALAANIEKLVRGLSGVFPSLLQWETDEMSLHRYDDLDVGLSFHKDNLRFIGLIGVLTLEGESDVVIRDDLGEEHVLAMHPGDLNLTRATGLYDAPKGDNLCPEHAVLNLRTPHRTSFIVRDNDRPQLAVPGFTYDNWTGESATSA